MECKKCPYAIPVILPNKEIIMSPCNPHNETAMCDIFDDNELLQQTGDENIGT